MPPKQWVAGLQDDVHPTILITMIHTPSCPEFSARVRRFLEGLSVNHRAVLADALLQIHVKHKIANDEMAHFLDFWVGSMSASDVARLSRWTRHWDQYPLSEVTLDRQEVNQRYRADLRARLSTAHDRWPDRK